jgi:pyruvate-formate lyase-activating enzyme
MQKAVYYFLIEIDNKDFEPFSIKIEIKDYLNSDYSDNTINAKEILKKYKDAMKLLKNKDESTTISCILYPNGNFSSPQIVYSVRYINRYQKLEVATFNGHHYNGWEEAQPDAITKTIQHIVERTNTEYINFLRNK